MPEIVARLVDDEYGIGIQLLPSGEIVYLAGKPKNRLPVDADSKTHDALQLARGDVSTLREKLVPDVGLLDTSLHKGVDLVLKLHSRLRFWWGTRL
jgi:hypothetical protein